MLSFLSPGWFLKRREARRFVELLFHEPPRRLDRTPLSMIQHLSRHLTKPGGFPPLPSRSKRVSCRLRFLPGQGRRQDRPGCAEWQGEPRSCWIRERPRRKGSDVAATTTATRGTPRPLRLLGGRRRRGVA